MVHQRSHFSAARSSLGGIGDAGKDSSSSSLATLRNGHVRLVVFDGHDHVSVLVVAKDLGARFLEAFEGLGGGVTVRVVRAHLDHSYLRLEAVEELWRRGGVGAVMRDLENDEGSGLHKTPLTA
jgi:hypothetical protein